jgi:hypothetical protein
MPSPSGPWKFQEVLSVLSPKATSAWRGVNPPGSQFSPFISQALLIFLGLQVITAVTTFVPGNLLGQVPCSEPAACATMVGQPWLCLLPGYFSLSTCCLEPEQKPSGRSLLHTPVIPATEEAEIRRIEVRSQPWANSSLETPPQKKNHLRKGLAEQIKV